MTYFLLSVIVEFVEFENPLRLQGTHSICERHCYVAFETVTSAKYHLVLLCFERWLKADVRFIDVVVDAYLYNNASNFHRYHLLDGRWVIFLFLAVTSDIKT